MKYVSKISVIVIAKKESDLSSILQDLEKQTRKDFEIVKIVGDMSIPKAWNTGVKKATGDIFLFTESDCSLPNDWVELLAQHVESNNFVIGSEVLTTWGGRCMSNVGVTAEIARKEPFDEKFRICEDTDWFERIIKLGYNLKRKKNPIVYHNREMKSFRRLWWDFLQGKYWTFIALKYCRPQTTLTKILVGRAYKLSRELMRFLGIICGIFCYSYMIPRKILREITFKGN